MDFGNQLILVSAGLVTLSILVGLVSNRIGAPLLLVFLVLGMLAGEDGPGGIEFDEFEIAYIVGSIALAIILFDGGLRTPTATLKLALAPSLLLATLGVFATAALTGAAARWMLDLSWVEGLLVGSIVASTDAAAVFFLLHLHGMRLRERVRATLEAESGLNDPMAVFLTLVCIELLGIGLHQPAGATATALSGMLLVQLLGGVAFGTAGGYGLLALVNRLRFASGLYPILAVSVTLLIFGMAQSTGASGFLAVYLAGLILGNHRHRATQLINRFHDGLAWLSQIIMFLMLGLLVTPTALLPMLVPALAIAAFLMLVARPLAAFLCLLPFRFTGLERLFISWVGLRGAVPIYLGTLPVLAGVEGALDYFAVAYVVVLTSLVIQGWTVGPVGRYLDMSLPPLAEAPQRVDIDLPVPSGEDIAVYVVQPESPVAGRRADHLRLPDGTQVISVIRDGALLQSTELGPLASGDQVLLMTRPEQLATLDNLFGLHGARAQKKGRIPRLGQFVFDASVPAGTIADFYAFPVGEDERDLTLGEYMFRHLAHAPGVGDRVRVDGVELVVHAHDGPLITRAGIDFKPAAAPSAIANARLWVAARLRALARRAAPSATEADLEKPDDGPDARE